MRIKKVILRQMCMPLLRPFTTSFGTMRDKRFVLVEAIDANGASGWAESTAFPEPSYNEETAATNWHILKDYLIPLVLERDFSHPEEIGDWFRRIRGNRMAKSAFEGACWDLYAQSQGVSLAKAIGGTKQAIEVGVSIGIKDSVGELLATIEDNIGKGYKRIKLKIQPGWDVAVIAAVRERFPDVALMVDANSAYTLADAEHLRQLDAYALTMIEQPLAHDDLVDHRLLQQRLATPICLDESIHSAEDARKAIELGSCRIVNLKIGRVGGIAEAIRVHETCRAGGIPVWCGGMLESGVGRAHNIAISSLPQFTLPGDTAASANYWEEDIIDPEVTVTDGNIAVPSSPGLGFEPNRRKIDARTTYMEAFAK
ncbi:o-succinylbenzoate synthase [Paenibacillus cymbidii]|uniref:o-succinylbenzoate synthase n=1 Tax=Paenibacillus cymbidii TaxID=1639034 RepID=UPI00108054F0|nr:o-succinylbenzoate synthase [Paenibacillus cymbidii]